MAIATKYPITFTCGHKMTADLASVPAGKRASRAHWMSKNQVCGKCFKAKSLEDLGKENQQTLLDADVFEQEHDLPELTGSEKQIPWATRVRYQLLAEGLEELDGDTEKTEELMAAARTITRSGWWIDYKDADADEIFEVVTTGAVTVKEQAATAIETENPF